MEWYEIIVLLGTLTLGSFIARILYVLYLEDKIEALKKRRKLLKKKRNWKKIVKNIFVAFGAICVIIAAAGFFGYFFLYCPGFTTYGDQFEGVLIDYRDLNQTIRYQPRSCDDPQELKLYTVYFKVPYKEKIIIQYDNQTCECYVQNYTTKSHLMAFDLGYADYGVEDLQNMIGEYVVFHGSFTHMRQNTFRCDSFDKTDKGEK